MHKCYVILKYSYKLLPLQQYQWHWWQRFFNCSRVHALFELGLFFMLWTSPLSSSQGKCQGYSTHVRQECAFKHFGEGPLQFQHDCASVSKACHKPQPCSWPHPAPLRWPETPSASQPYAFKNSGTHYNVVVNSYNGHCPQFYKTFCLIVFVFLAKR